jgi:hypothetical protein
MVTKPRGAKKSSSADSQSEITVDELISRLRPKLEDAHKRGWESWKDGNERPPNYCAGLADADLLGVLDKFRNQLMSLQPPDSGTALQSPPSGDTQITSDWTLAAREFEGIAAGLETLFEYYGQLDAAAHWRHSEGRLTVEEAWQRIKRAGEVDDAFLAKLVEAVRQGDLPTYAPGKNSRTAYAVQNELDGCELDTWLKDKEPHVKFRFSEADVDPGKVLHGQNGKSAKRERILNDIQDAYEKVRAETGKEPSERDVAKRSGYDRETVRKRRKDLLESVAKTSQNQPRQPAKTSQ